MRKVKNVMTITVGMNVYEFARQIELSSSLCFTFDEMLGIWQPCTFNTLVTCICLSKRVCPTPKICDRPYAFQTRSTVWPVCWRLYIAHWSQLKSATACTAMISRMAQIEVAPDQGQVRVAHNSTGPYNSTTDDSTGPAACLQSEVAGSQTG